MANTSRWRQVPYRSNIERWGIAMYDLTYGQVFCGTPTRKGPSGRPASTEVKQFSRNKIVAALVGLTLIATTAAGAVTIRHKASDVRFSSHSSSLTTGGSAGFETAVY
jgi:hypothetical protein